MELVDRAIYKLCPFVAGGLFVGSVYWTAVTYGAVTVMQVGFRKPNPSRKILVNFDLRMSSSGTEFRYYQIRFYALIFSLGC